MFLLPIVSDASRSYVITHLNLEAGFFRQLPLTVAGYDTYVNISNVQSLGTHTDLQGILRVRVNFKKNIRGKQSWVLADDEAKEIFAAWDKNAMHKKYQAQMQELRQELAELRDAIMCAPGGPVYQRAVVSFQDAVKKT